MRSPISIFRWAIAKARGWRYTTLLSSGRYVYESLFYLGAIAESREAWDEAVQIYSRVTGGDLAVAAQVRAAAIKTLQKDLKTGLQHLDDFGSTRPQYALDVVVARVSLMSNHDDREGAIKLLDSSLREYPDSSELRFARVFQLEAADEVDDAVDAMRALVKDRPGDPTASNALGYTLVDRTRHHREGCSTSSKRSTSAGGLSGVTSSALLNVPPSSSVLIDNLARRIRRKVAECIASTSSALEQGARPARTGRRGRASIRAQRRRPTAEWVFGGPTSGLDRDDERTSPPAVPVLVAPRFVAATWEGRGAFV